MSDTSEAANRPEPMLLPLGAGEGEQLAAIRALYRRYRGAGLTFQQPLERVPVGLFITLFFLLLRFLPIVSMSEVREMIDKVSPK